MELRMTAVPWKIWWNLFSTVLVVLQFKCSLGELRLGGGSTAREGRLEVAYENNIQPGHWASVCGDGWTNDDAIVACNEAGFPGPAVAIRHAKERYGESYLSIMLTNVNCEPEAASLVECRNTSADVRPCRTGREAGAICQMPGYQGCFKMVKVTLKSDDFMIAKNMTLDTCMAFCMNRSIRFNGVSVDHCHCWNNMPNTTTELMTVAHHHCSQHCPANPLQVCGGTKGLLKTFAIYDTYIGFCNDPGDIMNGYRDSDWFQFGSTVNFQCDEGYVMEGIQNLTCVESGPGYDWNDASPICNRLIVTTEPPSMPTEAGLNLNGEQKLEVLYVGVVGGGVALLLLIVVIAFTVACCKSRKKKPKKLIEGDDEEAQMGRLSKKKRRKKSKKSKKVKKKHKERDIDEKDKDELELDFDTEDDIDKDDQLDKDSDYDEEDVTVNENKANAKLDLGPIATADLSYYESEPDQAGKNKNKPLPSARGQGRPTSSSKPAKFNFIETDQRKNSKRSRGGMMKNVLFVKGSGDNASEILLKDA